MRQILFSAAFLVGVWADSAQAQCPAAIPTPANATAVQCFTLNKPVNVRCATAIEPAQCNFLNNQALTKGLLTQDGYNYLVSIRFCAINFEAFPGAGFRIYDFCPEGCFASDTQLLGRYDDGKASYVKASQVTPESTLVSMTDDSTLGKVALTKRSINRIVAGPEDADLYVFALANGKTLRVTMHHPMVIDSGVVITARNVTPDMSFVGMDGRSVRINSITREAPVGDVYNFVTKGETQLSHIIVAEDVLVGDLKIQGELADEEGSISLRR
jgi:hypothetical protein